MLMHPPASGYTRVIMAGLSLHYMSYHPIYSTLLYSVSCLLDAVDGQAARALGQTSKFGAVLDMVTDRWAIFFRSMACLMMPIVIADALPPVYCVISPPHIPLTPFYSNSSLLWTSAAIICICTGSCR